MVCPNHDGLSDNVLALRTTYLASLFGDTDSVIIFNTISRDSRRYQRTTYGYNEPEYEDNLLFWQLDIDKELTKRVGPVFAALIIELPDFFAMTDNEDQLRSQERSRR